MDRENGTRRKNKGFSNVHSEQVNVQSMIGVSIGRLQTKTGAFSDYDFHGNPWIAEPDWVDIIPENFPGVDPEQAVYSLKMGVKRTPYSEWRSLKRAITNTGSLVHLYQDGPLQVTMPSSFDYGVARLIAENEKRERDGRNRGWIFSGGSRVTDPS